MDSQQFGPPQRYRAVDLATGKASDPFTFGFDKQAQASLYTAFELRPETGDDSSWIVIPTSDVDGPIFCQSTGLHDANGIEIFAGDLLQWTNAAKQDPNFYFVAEWRDGAFWFRNAANPEHRGNPAGSLMVRGLVVTGNRWQKAAGHA